MAGLPDDFTGHDPTRPGAGGAAARAIRCPACRREHLYEPPSLPCPCGASLKVPLLRGGVPVQVRFRSWEDSWLSMRCPHCGRSDQWPQPEFTCNCGATVRLPVDRTTRLGSGTAGPLAAPGPQAARPHPAHPMGAPVPAPPAVPGGSTGRARPFRHRAPFRPHPVRTSQDAVFTAARYLEWLGFDDLELTEAQERDGVTLLGSRMVAQVDTWTEPADVKSVECLWLQTLHAEEMAAAMFTLAGYSHQATVRGEQLLVALFSLDLAGVPQPANGAAEALMETGWTS
ncbi:hypothetical protein ATKI12_6267 [Kitasatospora sp. Ki12]|uniref:hypothetical protein n=1 Tax=Kitasatospora xanthocidica TaxID=83382 RepID=UPI0019BFD318|nr:hypothetical protein [Kitasatospora xanthocidica]GHF40595.1 hypothetical protein GCM10018790_17760 [Kitasatospora xanthocidica]